MAGRPRIHEDNAAKQRAYRARPRAARPYRITLAHAARANRASVRMMQRVRRIARWRELALGLDPDGLGARLSDLWLRMAAGQIRVTPAEQLAEDMVSMWLARWESEPPDRKIV